MESTSGNGSTSCHLRLEGELTIFTAIDTKRRLLAPLLHCQQIDVDLSQVSDIDSAGLQLMLLAKREATAKGKNICFVAHGPAVQKALELCQLTSYFGYPAVMDSSSN